MRTNQSAKEIMSDLDRWIAANTEKLEAIGIREPGWGWCYDCDSPVPPDISCITCIKCARCIKLCACEADK